MISPKRLPYPGLRAFTRDESDLFFGREGCVDAMIDKLAETRFLAVLGASGSGKSSLVRTGLQDALQLGLHSLAGSNWLFVDLHPGGNPRQSLAEALIVAKTGEMGHPSDVSLLTAFLARGPRSVVEWASGGNLEPGTNLLLLVDQFEELFRYRDYSDREEAEAFVALLSESASARSASLHIVITMRSEFLGSCALIPGLAERINAGIYLTPRMNREECREAIEGPASVIGFRVEPALVNRLLNDLESFAPWTSPERNQDGDRLSRQADQLPLMQHVLNRLWQTTDCSAQSSQSVELKLAAYESLGGLSGALDSQGEEVLTTLGLERRPYTESIFRALINGSSLSSAVRLPCRFAELLSFAGCSRDDLMLIIESFRAQGCNFLRTSQRLLGSDEVIVDISHESLIRQWTPLGDWLLKEARSAAAWQRLISAYELHRKGDGGLLRGADLHSLNAWWESANPTKSWTSRYGGNFEEVCTFLEESRKAEIVSTQAELERERAVARKTAQVLEQLGRVIQSDGYVGLLGISNFQSALLETLEPFESEIIKEYRDVVNPAVRVRNEFQMGTAYERIGDAVRALVKYRQAYNDGIAALRSFSNSDWSVNYLKAATIQSGYFYSWFLFDFGDDSQAEEIMHQLDALADTSDLNTAPDELRLAYAQLENLRSRYFWARNQPDESHNHVIKAISVLAFATSTQDTTMEEMSLRFTLYTNVFGDDRSEYLRRAYQVAAEMSAKSPMDTRAIQSRVTCLQLQSTSASEQGLWNEAFEKLIAAEQLLNNILELAPEDQKLLLSMLDVQSDLSYWCSQQGDKERERDYTLKTQGSFVRALKGRTVLQTRIGEIKRHYQNFNTIDFSAGQDSASEARGLRFYSDILEAIEPTLSAFPNSRSFAYIYADASVRTSKFLRKDPNRLEEADAHLSKGLKWFKTSGVIDDLSNFSEDFAACFEAYAEQLEVFLQGGHDEELVASVDLIKESCSRVLDKYPWDFYLRMTLRRCLNNAGVALFRLTRYEEASLYLRFASHWGSQESSRLLARMYRGGLGVSVDEKEAGELEALASKQSVRRFTIAATIGGTPTLFPFYAQQWPSEYPFEGIDDQVIWLKEARGGIIKAEVADDFRELQRGARKENAAFPDLVQQFVEKVEQEKAEEQKRQQQAAAKVGLVSTAHPNADPERAMRLNFEHILAMKAWKQLPWWKRVLEKEPTRPSNI